MAHEIEFREIDLTNPRLHFYRDIYPDIYRDIYPLRGEYGDIIICCIDDLVIAKINKCVNR